MSVDVSRLERFKAKIARFNQAQKDEFYTMAAKNLAARLLRKVVKRTPVGVRPTGINDETVKRYWAGYKGGTLRRGWTGGKNTSAASYAQLLSVKKSGGIYSIDIVNPVEYAAYVEYGHRNSSRYVPQIEARLSGRPTEGRHMLQISVEELNSVAPGVLNQLLNKRLREVFE